MPLVECPDCGKQVSDVAPACIGCGRPLAEGAHRGAKPEPPETGGQSSEWRCESCGGDQLKKFSLLYEENRTTSKSRTTGVGLGVGPAGIGVGLGGARSRRVSATELAGRVAPPSRDSMMKKKSETGSVLVSILAFLAAYGGFTSGGFPWAVGAFLTVFIGGMVIVGKSIAPEIDQAFKKAMDRWKQSYLCLRCGDQMLLQPEGGISAVKGGDPEIDVLLREGKELQAVSVLLKKEGLSLTEARDRIEARTVELHL